MAPLDCGALLDGVDTRAEKIRDEAVVQAVRPMELELIQHLNN
jgi:hypothetical protein